MHVFHSVSRTLETICPVFAGVSSYVRLHFAKFVKFIETAKCFLINVFTLLRHTCFGRIAYI